MLDDALALACDRVRLALATLAGLAAGWIVFRFMLRLMQGRLTQR